MGYAAGVAIQSIVFHGDGAFDLCYAEQSDINPKGTIIRQLMVPPGVVPVEVATAMDALKELLDRALVERFDDPDTIASPFRHNNLP